MSDSLLYIVWDPPVYFFGILRWYSLCWLIGLTLGYFIVRRLYKDEKIADRLFDPLFFYVFLGVLIGARLGHCLFYQPDYFLSSWQHVAEMILPIHKTSAGVWKFTGYEGLASHGGVIGMLIALWLYKRWSKLRAFLILDNIALAAPLTAFFIRMGNLMNSEIIGRVTDVPWAFIFERVDSYPRHPGQLYEALAYLLLFFIEWIIYRRRREKPGSGFFFGLVLTYVFVFRFLIEYVKEIQEPFEAALPLDMGQILSVPFTLIGVVCLLRALRKGRGEGKGGT